MPAIQAMQAGNEAGALAIVLRELPRASDRAPYLALASHALLRLRRPAEAIPHLQELLGLNPADRATKANLANALLESGQFDDALALVAGSSVASLARIEGYILQQQGVLDGAAAAYRRAIAADPNDLSSWNNLGNILTSTDDIDGAVEAFERAIALAPADLPIYFNLAELLLRAERHEARLKTLLEARKYGPDDPRLLTELGLAFAKADDMEQAITTLKQAIDKSPKFGDAHIELGMIYESLNRVDDLAALVDGIDQSAAPAEFAFLLAWQARRDGDFDKAAKLAATIPESIHPMRRFHLIGGIADRRDDAATAFPAFERMNNEALAASPPLVGDSYRTQVERDVAGWSDDWAASWTDVRISDTYRDPIFLVGFPRSGTTLLDTMLMGLPTLSVLEERPMMARTVKLIGDDDLATLSAARIRELREAYFRDAGEYGWDRNRRLVDKHPLNMERVPAIHRLFPNAHFILAERHPYDVVLSCFMANFTVNLAMRSFTSLDEAARTFDAVFTAWNRGLSLFPVSVHAIRYERLVADATTELAPLVNWLGEEWHDDLLDHQQTAKTRGRVRTASYSQIGESLYTRAADRWRRYRDFLEPVLPILRPWAERMGYQTE
jgi:tetratricopeptide (TPR) repeat protein